MALKNFVKEHMVPQLTEVGVEKFLNDTSEEVKSQLSKNYLGYAKKHYDLRSDQITELTKLRTSTTDLQEVIDKATTLATTKTYPVPVIKNIAYGISETLSKFHAFFASYNPKSFGTLTNSRKRLETCLGLLLGFDVSFDSSKSYFFSVTPSCLEEKNISLVEYDLVDGYLKEGRTAYGKFYDVLRLCDAKLEEVAQEQPKLESILNAKGIDHTSKTFQDAENRASETRDFIALVHNFRTVFSEILKTTFDMNEDQEMIEVDDVDETPEEVNEPEETGVNKDEHSSEEVEPVEINFGGEELLTDVNKAIMEGKAPKSYDENEPWASLMDVPTEKDVPYTDEDLELLKAFKIDEGFSIEDEFGDLLVEQEGKIVEGIRRVRKGVIDKLKDGAKAIDFFLFPTKKKQMERSISKLEKLISEAEKVKTEEDTTKFLKKCRKLGYPGMDYVEDMGKIYPKAAKHVDDFCKFSENVIGDFLSSKKINTEKFFTDSKKEYNKLLGQYFDHFKKYGDFQTSNKASHWPWYKYSIDYSRDFPRLVNGFKDVKECVKASEIGVKLLKAHIQDEPPTYVTIDRIIDIYLRNFKSFSDSDDLDKQARLKYAIEFINNSVDLIYVMNKINYLYLINACVA